MGALVILICCIAFCLLYFMRQSHQTKKLLHKQTIELETVRTMSVVDTAPHSNINKLMQINIEIHKI